jgi:hypothetical protein
VQRAGIAVDTMKVKLYDDAEGVQVDSAYTDETGAYGFSNVRAGRWMVKVSPPGSDDLEYVRFFIDLVADGAPATIPPFDIASHGFDLIAPADGSVEARPSVSSPLRLEWSLYQATYEWTSARISDQANLPVWASSVGQTTHADWDGVGNDGSYAGQPAPPGHYLWRVKIRLPYGVQAATRQRAFRLRPQ